MTYLTTLLFLLLSTSVEPVKPNKPALESGIFQLANELTSKYSNNYRVQVAILEFRTLDDKVSKINQLIQKELTSALTESPNFKVIEQYSMNRLVDEVCWSLATCSSFKVYSALNENLFKSTGNIADVFIYGTVSMEGENLVITGYLVPDGVASKAIKSKILIPKDEIPENVLD